MSTSGQEAFRKLLDNSNSPYLAFYKRYFFRLMDDHNIRKEYAQHIEDVLEVGAYKVDGEEADRFFRIINPSISLYHNGDVLDKFLMKKFRPHNFKQMSEQQIFESVTENVPRMPYFNEYGVFSLREMLDEDYHYYVGEGDCTTYGIATAAYVSICGREPGSLHLTSTHKGTAHIVGMGYNSQEKEWMIFDNFAGAVDWAITPYALPIDVYLEREPRSVRGPRNNQVFYQFGPASLTRLITEPEQDIQYIPVPPEKV
jgi:hypothetical protein